MRVVVNLCGLPGSGKSFLAREVARFCTARDMLAIVIEGDWMDARMAAGECSTRQLLNRLFTARDRFFFPACERQVVDRHRSRSRPRPTRLVEEAARPAFAEPRQRRAREGLRDLLEMALRAIERLPCAFILDDNFLTCDSRKKIRGVAHHAGASHIAVCLNTPVAVCVHRDAGRRRPVGEKVITADAARWEPQSAAVIDWQRAFDAELLDSLLQRAALPVPPPAVQPKSPATLVEEALRRHIAALFAQRRLSPADAGRATELKRAFLTRRKADIGHATVEALVAAFDLEVLRPPQ